MVSNLVHYSRIGITVFALGLLGACANITTTPPGTPVAQVEAKFGRANYACPEANGGQRLIWSTQPSGQYAWGTHVDSAGRTDQIVPLLTDEHFEILKEGVWTPEKVLCEFGPPAIQDKVGLPSARQIVWSYRYLQNKVWNSLMYVYFGQDGSHVTRFHPGPDPAAEPDHWMF